jgi:hypothetical protein
MLILVENKSAFPVMAKNPSAYRSAHAGLSCLCDKGLGLSPQKTLY